MPTQRAIEIANAFTKYAKTGDKSIIKQFTLEEIETTLLQYHLDRGWAHYVAMEKRIEELKEEQGSNKKTGENWYKKTEIQVALMGGLFLLLAAFISAPHWWPWYQKSPVKDITPKEIIQSGNNNTQIMTTGNNSPVTKTNIEKQNIYVNSQNYSSFQNYETIKQLTVESQWSIPNQKGDRESYLKLLSWQKQPKDDVAKVRLDSAIKDIENAYAIDVMRLHIEPIRNPRFWWICKSGVSDCSLGFEEPIGYKANNVIAHLTRSYWQERGRAASILRNIRTASDKNLLNKELFFEKLVERMNPEEDSLFVAKMAFETYKDLTGFSSPGVFDFDKAIDDWKQRKEEILKINF